VVNRFYWVSLDDTSLLLKKLNNDELAIEKTDLYATPEPAAKPETAASPAGKPPSRPLKPGGRDSGGGFNPYDHAGKKRR
jgi:hypothetical protein